MHPAHHVVRVLAAGATLAASMASAQDASTAHIAALHRAVFELPIERPFPDAGTARDLALRYVEGRDVERDPVMGCAAVQLALASARHANDEAARVDTERLVDLHCGALDNVQRDEALQQMACPAFGLKKQAFNLEPGAWLEVASARIAIDRPAGRTEYPMPANFTCNHQFVLVKHTTVAAPLGAAAPARQLLQFLSWTGGHGAGGLMRALQWVLVEASTKVEHRAVEFLVSEAGSAWPAPPVPESYRDGAALTMRADGSVRWQFPGGSAEGTIDPLRH